MDREFWVLGLIPGFLVRLGLICYSVYHDQRSALKYTDIDYQVFSDAARSLLSPSSTNGSSWFGSPYDRATYRYTPLLAILLTPNELIHPCWGKALFSLADLLIGIFLYQLCPKHTVLSLHGRLVILIWVLNPFVISISTRGSSEALIGVVIVSFLFSAERKKWHMAAVLLGLAVHLKIFPFLYAAGVWARLGRFKHPKSNWFSINRSQFRFGATSLLMFIGLNSLMYLLWGHEFIEHSFLYHLRRLDHRHNFSPYFYPIYLRFTSSVSNQSSAIKILQHPLISFIPQMSLSLFLGFYYGQNDLAFACFIQTYVFVTLNKVVTSQYIMWYLWFIPLLVKKIKLSILEFIGVATIWIATQAIWLSQGYRLEFLGEPVFKLVWLSSLAFLIGNSWIIGMLIVGYSRSSLPGSRSRRKDSQGVTFNSSSYLLISLARLSPWANTTVITAMSSS